MKTSAIFSSVTLSLIFLLPCGVIAKPSANTKIVVESDLSSVSVNAPVRVDWYIQSTKPILAIDVVTLPKINGGELVPSEPIKKLDFKIVTEDGIVYQKALFLSQVVKSSSPGKIEISPLVLKIAKARSQAKGKPYLPKKSKPEEIASAPLTVTVTE